MCLALGMLLSPGLGQFLRSYVVNRVLAIRLVKWLEGILHQRKKERKKDTLVRGHNSLSATDVRFEQFKNRLLRHPIWPDQTSRDVSRRPISRKQKTNRKKTPVDTLPTNVGQQRFGSRSATVRDSFLGPTWWIGCIMMHTIRSVQWLTWVMNHRPREKEKDEEEEDSSPPALSACTCSPGGRPAKTALMKRSASLPGCTGTPSACSSACGSPKLPRHPYLCSSRWSKCATVPAPPACRDGMCPKRILAKNQNSRHAKPGVMPIYYTHGTFL